MQSIASRSLAVGARHPSSRKAGSGQVLRPFSSTPPQASWEEARELTGGFEEVEAGALALEIGVEESHPTVVLLETGLFHVSQIDAALSKLCLEDLYVFLCKFQLQACDFARGCKLAVATGVLADAELDLLAHVA